MMKIKSIRDVKISKKLMILGAVSILGLFLMGKESIATARQIDQVGAELNDVWMNAVIAAEEYGNLRLPDYRKPPCSDSGFGADGRTGTGYAGTGTGY